MIRKTYLHFAVVICFQISIFEPLKTALIMHAGRYKLLWFAFKLVSLNHWKQQARSGCCLHSVVICFQISIFEPLKTATLVTLKQISKLWFAFKLVSLNHWKQLIILEVGYYLVVICFQISIFEPLKTAKRAERRGAKQLWFAFKLVSLNHWKQLFPASVPFPASCDLLSN